MNKLLFILAVLSSFTGFTQTVIFSEDFQSGIPNVWQYRDLDGLTPDTVVSEYTDAFISKMDPSDSSNLTASATSYFSPVGTANRWLISPGILMGAYGNAMEWKAKSHDPSYPETYLVLVSTTDDLEASFTDTIGFVIEEYADWTVRTVDLSAMGYDNETIFVAFILQTNDGFKFYLDDVSFSIEDPAGIEENKVQNLSLKTIENGWFEIDSELIFDTVLVMDNTGRIIKETSNKIIDIRSEQNGMYFIQAKSGNQLFSSKVIR